MTDYFPAFLNVEGKQCLVVGGGKVAQRKIRSLLRAGAQVKVISRRRSFQKSDLKDIFLVIAATGNKKINQQIARLATEQNLLINVVDDSALGNFIFPAVAEYQGLKIAISTSGQNPLFARLLKEKLKRDLKEKYFPIFAQIKKVRPKIILQPEKIKKKLWEKWEEKINKALL